MPQEIPVDLAATGGRLLPPGAAATRNPGGPGAALPKPPPTPGPGAAAAALQQEANDRAAAAAAGPKQCRRCGADPAADPAAPSAEDLFGFTRCVWRDEPFTKAYEFFGGAVKVVFRTLTADEAEAVDRVVMAEAAVQEFPAGPAGSLIAVARTTARAEELRTAAAVQSLAVGGKQYTAPPPGPAPDVAAAGRAVREMTGTDVTRRALREAYRQFCGVIDALTAKGADPSFWPATAPAGPSPASPPPATRA